MRGLTYIWDDDEPRVHIWVADGYDFWDDSVWHHVDDGKDFPIQPSHCRDGENIASGVSIPHETMDEYVVMRMAELIDEGLLDSAIDRALAKWSRASLRNYKEQGYHLVRARRPHDEPAEVRRQELSERKPSDETDQHEKSQR